MFRVVLLVSVFLVARGQFVDPGQQGSACPTLVVGSDVIVSPPECTSQPSPTDTTCSFKCTKGHRISGPPYKECLDDGVWSHVHIDVICEDINECDNNNGGCSHTCVNKDGSYECTCPDPLVLSDDNLTCRAMGLLLNCGDHSMDVTIPKKALRDLQGDYLRLVDPACKASENETHYSFSTALDGCGTKRRSTKDFLVYSNRVVEKPVDQSGLITRVGKNEFNIPFCCYYLNNGIITSVGYEPKSSDLFLKEQGYGRFKVKLDFYDGDYNDGLFQSQHAQSDFPVEVSYRQRLYFEVNIATLDQGLVVQAGNCCSTPTADHDNAGRFRHELIHEGCPVDSTTQLESSSSRQRQRFSVEAFKFVGMFPFVYIHCSVIVCKANDSNSRCAKGCVPGLNVNPPVSSDEEAAKSSARGRRAVSDAALHTYMLSRGPFTLSSNEDDAIALVEPQEEQVEGDVDKESDEENVGEEKDEKSGQDWNQLRSGLLVVLAISTVLALVGLMRVRKIMNHAAKPRSYQLMTS